MKTKDLKEPEVKSVIQYKFHVDSLKILDDEDEFFQRWMLLAIKVACDSYSSTYFKTNAANFLNNGDTVGNVSKLKKVLDLKKLESSDKEKLFSRTGDVIKKIIDGGWGDVPSDGSISKVCKDVKSIVMDETKKNLFEEFKVIFQERETVFND